MKSRLTSGRVSFEAHPIVIPGVIGPPFTLDNLPMGSTILSTETPSQSVEAPHKLSGTRLSCPQFVLETRRAKGHPMQFQVSETCPRCGKPVSLAIVELHPTRTDLALHSFECIECGSVRTRAVPLRADKPPPELAV
jgi:hypothetical protein